MADGNKNMVDPVRTSVIEAVAGQLRVLSRPACAELLRTKRLGRLAFAVGGQAKIFPLNYHFDGHDVVVRTGRGFKLAEAPMRNVAFEVDAAGEDGSWGWSVVVEGTCFNLTGALDDASEKARRLPVRAWPPGERDQFLRIDARRVSGRAFGEVPESPSPVVAA